MAWSFTFHILTILQYYYYAAEGFPIINTAPENAAYSSSGSFEDPTTTYEDNNLSGWIFLAIISIGSMISLVTALFICGAGEGCCGLPKIYWFGRSRQQTPLSFDNPVTELGRGGGLSSSIPLSQIDVRALELDPVVFEPLPTIHDLSPLSLSSSQVNSPEEGGGKYSGKYLPVNFPTHQQKTLLISAFANEDSELYAHDWFDEPYRNFQRRNLEFVQEVGEGWFGQVLEAAANDIVPFAKTIRVVVKRLKQDASQLDQMRFLDESRIYRDANQGNILKLLGHCIEKLPFLLIYERTQVDLKSYLISNVTRGEYLSSQGILLNMALDIAKGLDWIIGKGFKHPDLASRNCQVASEGGRIVIGDYGLATQMYKDDYYWNCGVPIPLRWAAPETIHCTTTTIQTLKVTQYSNIFTFGILLWEITEFAKLPYFELSDEEVITRVFADKTHLLGHPSLPYIPFKEELYQVMKSCWSVDPAQRPKASTIVSQLQELCNKLQSELKKDSEFESKWERLGGARNSSSSSSTSTSNYNKDGSLDNNNRPRGAKKSVSFTGIQNIKLQEISESQHIPNTNNNNNINDQPTTTTKDDVFVSDQQVHKNRREQEEEEDDEGVGDNEKWLQEMDKDGGIVQKVMQKTQSVQDFMVLTHVEPSDIHGPESLMDIGGHHHGSFSGRTAEFYPSSSIDSSQASSSDNSSNKPPNDDNKESVGGSSSATTNNDAADALSLLVEASPSIGQGQTGSSVFIIPNSSSSSSSSQSENVNNLNISSNDSSFQSPLQKSTLTDNRPSSNNVPEIAVQFSTPAPAPGNSLDSSPVISKNINNLDRNHEPRPNGRRHTSTPKRSGSTSPLPPLDNSSNGFCEDVFEIEEAAANNSGLNESCNLSPISMKRARRNGSGIRSNNEVLLVTTIVGASDDLGLGMFQGVTSQLEGGISYNNNNNSSNSTRHSSSETDDIDDDIQNSNNVQDCGKITSSQQQTHFKNSNMKTTPFVGGDIRVLAGGIGKPMSLTPRPVLLCNGNNSEEEKRVRESESTTMLLEADSQSSSSWDVVSNSNGSSSWDVVSSSDSKDKEKCEIKVYPLGPQLAAADDEKDINAFWNRQIKSLSSAAQDTKSLLALSLETAEPTAGDKFVADINLANEELGSLVLEDLESGVTSKSLIPESHHHDQLEEQGNKVKLAFTAGRSSPSTDDNNYQSGGSHHTAVEPWSEGEVVDKIDEEKTTSLLSSKDFVPSTWNNSLTPARPAIKSPAAVCSSSSSSTTEHDQKATATSTTSSSLKKSVSFERQPRQIVYEYPPPVNDFEEDMKIPTIPLHSSLDWDLTQEELEFAQNADDSDDDVAVVNKSNPMDMYRISGFEFEDSFKVRGSSEPFIYSKESSPISKTEPTTTLGQLRHTRDKLKLNLNKGEASLLDNDRVGGGNNEKFPMSSQDSGVGSSTNPSPFYSTTTSLDHVENNDE